MLVNLAGASTLKDKVLTAERQQLSVSDDGFVGGVESELGVVGRPQRRKLCQIFAGIRCLQDGRRPGKEIWPELCLISSGKIM